MIYQTYIASAVLNDMRSFIFSLSNVSILFSKLASHVRLYGNRASIERSDYFYLITAHYQNPWIYHTCKNNNYLFGTWVDWPLNVALSGSQVSFLLLSPKRQLVLSHQKVNQIAIGVENWGRPPNISFWSALISNHPGWEYLIKILTKSEALNITPRKLLAYINNSGRFGRDVNGPLLFLIATHLFSGTDGTAHLMA